MRASNKDIIYDNLFELNFEYYRKGADLDQHRLDNINYFINPLLGGVMKLRFDNSIPYMKKWLKDREPKKITQTVYDYLYNNLKHWKKLQLVIPTVTLSIEMIAKLGIDTVKWVVDMKKAVVENNKEAARELHKQLLKSIMDIDNLTFNYKINPHTKKPIDYLHIIAEKEDGKKVTVDLNRLFGDDSWNPVNLILNTMVDQIK